MGTLKVQRILACLFAISFCCSCQMGYLIKNGWNQMSLLAQREPLDQALQNPQVSDEEKRKLRLAIEVREFAAQELGLKVDQIYTSYVKLDRPYVTWVVSASPQWKLESWLWSFPIVGKMPYKGFFSEKEALEEKADLEKKTLDTYVRGVSAYSTLGWFKDPLLSSMMGYKDHDLVETIIHELVHATLYIKHQADFNERFAVFLGHQGMELFYLKKEGPDSATLKAAKIENEDEKLFSVFISQEIDRLNEWYQKLPEAERNEEIRMQQFADIKNRFKSDVLPRMKTKNWERFPEVKLNNARLSVYKTYMKNLDDFAKLYQKLGFDFRKFMELCRKLESHPDPEAGLKEMAGVF